MDSVAIYCRLSDEDKNKVTELDDSESIQNQKNLLIKYAGERGWGIYKIYSDDDYSGMDKERPEFNQMLRDAEFGRFNIILCKHQSRFTRDMELVEKYLHNKFLEWGIRFVTVVDGVDTLNKQNKKARQINGLVNEWYCEDISESIRAVFNMKQRQGKFIGSFATYGYIKDPKDRNKIIVDVEAAEVVKHIFNLYTQGYGTLKIAKILNEKEILNPSEYKKSKGLNYKNSSSKDSFGLWNKTTVKRILQNEVYLGNMVQHKYKKINYKSQKTMHLKKKEWITVEGTHEAIIDKATFSTIQERLIKNRRTDGKGKTFIFSRKLKCMDCGKSMSRSTNKVGKSYLRCSTYGSSPAAQKCTSHSIRLDILESIVIEKIRYYINNLCDAGDMGKKLLQEQTLDERIKSLEREIEKINKEIDKRDKALKKLYVDRVGDVIQEEQFLELNNSFLKEKKELSLRKEGVLNDFDEVKSKAQDFEQYVKIVAKYQNFQELTYVMVNELIDYIEIGEKDSGSNEQRVKIVWKF